MSGDEAMDEVYGSESLAGDDGEGNGKSGTPSTRASSVLGNGVGTGGSPIKQAEVVCDDCGKEETIRIWRWCTGCERALCETCCVEGHMEHLIESYATAVRRSNDEVQQTINAVGLCLDELRKGSAEVQELNKDIVNKLNAMKRDMRGKFDESKDIADTLKEHLSSMNKLQHQSLNAKTWTERQQSVAGMETLFKTAANKQDEMDDYLKMIDEQVDESVNALSQILRENQ